MRKNLFYYGFRYSEESYTRVKVSEGVVVETGVLGKKLKPRLGHRESVVQNTFFPIQYARIHFQARHSVAEAGNHYALEEVRPHRVLGCDIEAGVLSLDGY